ncbi:hypothetical protein BDV97DRAFT_401172 [Delphinella strobiligena]|nr:hypothetical protein BDV97DRAFT_401172 [Delphinella strobiligena]
MSDTTDMDEHSSHSSLRSSVVRCAACNNDPENANRIKELENEVRMLEDKAVAAADKIADYEEELRLLKSQGMRSDTPIDVESLPVPDRPDMGRRPSAPEFLTHKSSTSRFSFLHSKKPLPSPPSSSHGMIADLEAALARETMMREAAEKKATDVENEIEDVTATLFEQANEMVATERREKAELEQRLLKLESWGKDRGGRLDRLEAAIERLERVKALLTP